MVSIGPQSGPFYDLQSVGACTWQARFRICAIIQLVFLENRSNIRQGALWTPLLFLMEKVRRIAPLSQADDVAYGGYTGAEAVLALVRYFVDTGFVVV